MINFIMISLFVSFGYLPTTMDAVSATIVVGGRPILLKQEVSIEKYYYLLYFTIVYVNSSSATSPNTMDGSPARWIALIHQLHVAGEEGGSATMVAVFVRVCCCVFALVASLRAWHM